MLRLTLAQMRRSLGRLTAAGIAIVISTAFVAATLLAGDAMTRTTYDAVSRSYAQADLVLSQAPMTGKDLAVVGSVPGVEAVHAPLTGWVEVPNGGGITYLEVTTPAQDPRLEGSTVLDGRLPDGPGQIAMPADVVERLGLSLADQVPATQTTYREDPEDPENVVPDTLEDELELVGVLDDTGTALMGGGPAVVDRTDLARWLRFLEPEATTDVHHLVLVAVQDGVPVTEVRESLRTALDGDIAVRTVDEQAAETVAGLTNSAQVFTAIVLGFAAIALLVAALVIANTFQVLVAQRTRTLALLRCVGADRAQLRRSVVTEALLLGVAASVVGTALGTLVVQGVLGILTRMDTDVPVPDGVNLTAVSVLVPVAVGVTMTVLAALAPARAATRVAPLAALRPAEAPRVTHRSGRVRAVLSGLLMVGGFAGLALGVVIGPRVDLMLGLAVGVLGGAASFVGVLLGSVFWVPRLVGRFGRLLSRGGVAATLAAANTVRNPRRTAATSAALLIGVTLVAMMSTGAASTRASLDEALNDEFPVDVEVITANRSAGAPAMPADVLSGIRGTAGIAAVAELTSTVVMVNGTEEIGVDAVDPAAAAEVLRSPEQLAGLDASSVVVPAAVARWSGITTGSEVTMLSDDGTSLTLTAVVTDLAAYSAVVLPEVLEQLDPSAAVTSVWVRLAHLDDVERVVAEIQQLASGADVAVAVQGAAVERAFYQRVINTLLAVVVGLLGVAVVIALIGVANTLSLSVLERRRESATLRAIGLSRRQLRGTLAIEGMLIAGVGAVVGSVLGVAYGWAGAQTVLGEVSSVGLTVPWRDLALVLVVALLAGLLASVVPGRSAARTSPVAALAVE
ncbi:ABC transporter permease [Actinotalea sp. K2]|uniref:ABC transporter permease n=1 Tax=Actinotalea sp. K2 TaxID=2939438 RepID=UPI002017D7F1|nr:ABC transporter permease [Actinotalea sp. K2]MCL3862747.1 ABC transporter permease [Actinotalea sp. K2]